MKSDLEKIFLCASLDTRNGPGRFPAQQVPGFFVGVVFRACHGWIQAYRRHAADYFFGEDVPNIFGNYVGGYEIEGIFLVDVVSGSDGAVVAASHLVDGGFHLDTEDSRALVVHQGIVSGRLSPRSGRAQSLLDGPQGEAHLGPCSSIFGILDVHAARFFHALVLFSCALLSICLSSGLLVVPTKKAASGGRAIFGT
ncbi:MAG: hypothetical protein WA254_21220 [Candidatus Sulfotelmatobacter sp.]